MEVYDKETIKYRLSLKAEDVASKYIPFVEGEDGSAAPIAKVLEDPLASYQQIFDTVWTSEAWTDDDLAACRSYVLSPDATPLNRLTLVSAVGVALLDTYDERKLVFLCDMLDGVRADESIRAALFLFLFVARRPGVSSLSATLRQRLDAFRSNLDIVGLFTFLQLNIIAVKQSDKVSVNYEKEIFRRAAEKMDAVQQIGEVNPDNMEDLFEEHPELKAICDDVVSLVHDAVKLRFRGVDTSYPVFAKSVADIPFFAEPSNWFCPFSFDHPDLFNISSVARFMAVVADAKSCDTDRFALLFSIPEGAAEVKIVKTDAATLANENIEGEEAEDLMHDFVEQHVAHQRQAERPLAEMPRFLLYRKVCSCVIDTFRFYQLYGPEAGIDNPFCDNIFGWRNADLAPLFSRPFSREAIAGWLQEFSFYEEASELYVDVLRQLINDGANKDEDEEDSPFEFSVDDLAEDEASDFDLADFLVDDEATDEEAEAPSEEPQDPLESLENLEPLESQAPQPPQVPPAETDGPAQRLLRRKADICHNLGICHEKLGNVRASQVYLRLSLRYVPDNLKVVRELADSYRSTERWKDALPLLQQLCDALPPYNPAKGQTRAQEAEEHRLTRQLASTLIHLERYDEALPLLVKADYKHPDHIPTLRLLAWTYLVCSEAERAEQKFRTLLASDRATADDYFRAAHCALINDNVDLAVERYKESLRRQNIDVVADDFLAGDMPFLVLHGVDPVIIEYIPDLINSL